MRHRQRQKPNQENFITANIQHTQTTSYEDPQKRGLNKLDSASTGPSQEPFAKILENWVFTWTIRKLGAAENRCINY